MYVDYPSTRVELQHVTALSNIAPFFDIAPQFIETFTFPKIRAFTGSAREILSTNLLVYLAYLKLLVDGYSDILAIIETIPQLKSHQV